MDPALQKTLIALAAAHTQPNYWVIGGQLLSVIIGVIGSGFVAWHAAARSARLAAQHSIQAQTDRIAKTLDVALRTEARAVLKIIVDALAHQSEQVQIPVAALADKTSLSIVYRGSATNLGTLDEDRLRNYVEFYTSLSAIPSLKSIGGLPLFLKKDLLNLKTLAEKVV